MRGELVGKSGMEEEAGGEGGEENK